MTNSNNKFKLILTTVFAFATLLISFSSNLNTNAQIVAVDHTFKVNTTKGLNLRDSNCNYITTMPYGSLVTSAVERNNDGSLTKPKSLTCEVKGVDYLLEEVYYTITEGHNSTSSVVQGYAAKTYLDLLKTGEDGGLGGDSIAFYVAPDNGLNVRDKKCKKVSALSKNSPISISMYGGLNEITCQVNGVKYSMTSVGGENKGYVATAFLQSADSQNIDAAPAKNLSYTNPYFDNLKINYSSDWEFTTNTTASRYSNLLDRYISLTKGDTTLNLYMQPVFPTGCTPGDEYSQLTLAKADVAGSSFNRFDSAYDQYVYSQEDKAYADCFLSVMQEVESNIDTPSDYMLAEGKVNYFVSITVNGSQHLEGADQIIANSSIK
ncbi:MAG: hypothetical protein AAGF07_03975 [Patescibacteria group bacterium]